MKNFLRAVRDGLTYWRSLLLATLCSVGVAAVWGGNIGALFPVIEVTLGGEPLQAWIRQEITAAEKAIDDANHEITALRGQEIGAGDATDRQKLNVRIDRLSARIAAEQASLESSKRLRPYIDRYLPRDPQQTVLLVVVLLLLATVVKHVLLLANTFLVARVSHNIARNIRLRIFGQALQMDRAGFMGYGASGLTAQITHTTEMLANGITNVFGGAVREPLKLLACLYGASLICWRLLVISLIIVPITSLLIVVLSHRIKSVCQHLLKNSIGLHHVMLEAFNNMTTVKAYNMEPLEQRRFERATNAMLQFSLKTTVYNAFSRPITESLAVGMVGTTILVGSYLVLNHETHLWGVQICDRPLTVSSLLVFFGLLVGATDPVRKMSTVVEGINTGIVAADMIYRLLDRPARIRDPERPRTISRPHAFLQFEGVCFGYGRELVLRDVSFKVAYGTKVALVGPNGSGKSSLVHLLCRFYDPRKGQIRIDGVDLRDLGLTDLRSRIGLVTQNTELFNETILYNIKYGCLERTDAEVIEAAKLAHAHDFITASTPHKYQTRVGQNGHRLSGGQRQRVALARAFLRDPEILILDEATNQIDIQSEQLIHAAIEQLGRHRTVIMITHRTSMLEIADVVFEFREGRVTQRTGRQQRVA